MADTSRAWVMDIGDGVAVAAGAAHVVEYLLAADPVPVPRTPEHCAGLMVWRERLVPVIDLARLLTGRAAAPDRQRRAVVLAYQQAAGRPLQYGALLVNAPPDETWVSDDMACALPDRQPALAHIARSCFSNRDQAVAILDPRLLFDRPLPGAAAPATEAESPAIDHEPRDCAPAVDHPPVSERAPPRPTADAVPYLRIVPAAPTAIESAPSVPAAADDPESTARPPETVVAETVDIEWPAALDDLAGPVPADSGAELPPVAEVPRPADLAPPPVARPDRAGPGARAGAEPAAAAPRAASNTVRSFERLHDLERRHTPAPGRNRRGWLAAAAALLLVVAGIGGWSLIAPLRTPAPVATDPNRPEMVKDAAALAVPPALVPSQPAQPPK